MKFLALATALLAIAAPAAAANLVTNGNFSAGDTGFTSDYSYRAPGNYGGALAEGLYAIDTSAFNTHPAWQNFADHTGDAAALYLIANGAGNASTIWQQSVSVTANSTYNFSVFAANTCCNANQAPPNFSELSLQADSGSGFVSVAEFTLSGVGTWLSTGGNFTAGSSNVVLRIVNNNTIAGGNDFALDDISLTAVAVPEPATWGLMVAGFGLVGAGMRRRSRAIAA